MKECILSEGELSFLKSVIVKDQNVQAWLMLSEKKPIEKVAPKTEPAKEAA